MALAKISISNYCILKSDTLLLTDVFKNFRKICLVVYGLVPANYFRAHGLAW